MSLKIKDFSSSSILFIESKIQKIRLNFMKKAAKETGFEVVEILRDDTAFIISELDSKEKVIEILKRSKQRLDLDKLSKVEIVNADWFTASVEAGQFIPVEDFHRLRSSLKNLTSLKKEPSQQPKSHDYENAKYCCQRITPLKHRNHKLTDALELLEKHAEFLSGENNMARALAFRKASAAIKAYPRPIRSLKEVENLNDLKGGSHCKRVIQDILEDGICHEVEDIQADEWFQTMKIFTGVFGCGSVTAKKWYDKGLRSLQDLKTSQDLRLTREQKEGVEHYDDLNTPVTKTEADKIMIIVKAELHKIDEGATITMTGGFLRGKDSGHDVDFLISHPVEGQEQGLLNKLLKILRPHLLYIDAKENTYKEGGNSHSKQFTLDHFERCFSIFKLNKSKNYDLQDSDGNHRSKRIKLSEQSEQETVNSKLTKNQTDQSEQFELQTDHSNETNHQTDQSDKDWIARRVDFVITPNSQYPYALLGWTGSRMFCRSIRDYAGKEMGMSLTSHGLFDKTTHKNLEAKTEKDIFDHLKLTYREPHQRNC